MTGQGPFIIVVRTYALKGLLSLLLLIYAFHMITGQVPWKICFKECIIIFFLYRLRYQI